MKPKYNKGFTQVGRVLTEKITEYKLEKTFYKSQAIKYWDQVAAGYIEQVKEQAKAVDLKNGVLVVACLCKELAYQIKLLSQRIIYEINRLIGKQVVFAIYVES